MPINRKRRPEDTKPVTFSSPTVSSLSTKRQKRDKQQQDARRSSFLSPSRASIPPTFFWDNLSQLHLTRRSLKEFDQRTLSTKLPCNQFGSKEIDFRQLKGLARHGGPSLASLRAYSKIGAKNPYDSIMNTNWRASKEQVQSEEEYSEDSERGRSRAESRRHTSAYDAGFEQYMIDHGLFPDEFGDEATYPDNLDQIKERLRKRRPSLSPTRFTFVDFRNYKRKNLSAMNEDMVVVRVLPIIAGTSDIASQVNFDFNNLAWLTGEKIANAKPDLYDGIKPDKLDSGIRKELDQYIIPSTNKSVECLPNFFTEVKGPKGLMEVGVRQALYDGAIGARAMLMARSLANRATAYDGNAYTLSSTYNKIDGSVQIYATHPTRSKDKKRRTDYWMTHLDGATLMSSPEAFRTGATLWRNARDLAKEERERVVAALNAKAQGVTTFKPKSSGATHPTQLSATGGGRLSPDELSLDSDRPHRPPSRTPMGPPAKSASRGVKNLPARQKPGAGAEDDFVSKRKR